MRYFMDLSYAGEAYHGWQRQKNAHSIQQEIENALSTIFQSDMSITGSGRTDTGVHAIQQVAHFDLDSKIMPMTDLHFKLNSLLPGDIAVNRILKVIDSAHARFDATSRTYHYVIHQHKDPFKKGRSYYYRSDLDLGKIAEACDMIRNCRDFECFSRVKTDVSHFECEIQSISWEPEKNGFIFRVSANRFLRGMVRAMVGTLLEMGLSRLSLQEFDLILKNKDRTQAGPSVPAEGLYLARIDYPSEIYL